MELRERTLSGIDYLNGVTALLQRIRNAHPTAGLYQAAELQWWWREPRATDQLPQLFWFDDHDHPAAAFVATDFSQGGSSVFDDTTVSFIAMPDTPHEWISAAIDRGLAHLATHGLQRVSFEVDHNDELVVGGLTARGLTRTGDGIIVGWLAADDRPPISPLAAGYSVLARADTLDRPHHFGTRATEFTEPRLAQTSLYRADLDLAVYDKRGDVGGYGLFWFDPVTATGVVEPMRTADEHQRRGLARHILTVGIDRLAELGATRISIGWEPDNPASGPLYRSVGFVPGLRTDVFSGTTHS
jgi:RimJ/RimL family protein N-acetyltransferase